MGLEISYDGADSHGVRAEVNVMTGTGRIKGLATSAGALVLSEGVAVPRNVEIIFDPDNPMLKKKVGAWIDTNAKDLWELVKLALADQRTIFYRIESQRRKGVDRTIPFGKLVHAEQVNRILAGLSTVGESTPMVMSHEAKTDPKEDPDQENPSAIGQDHSLTPSNADTILNPKTILEGLAIARQNNLSTTVIETLMAYALGAGATLADINGAGFTAQAEDDENESSTVRGRVAALEERPWIALNSDGRPNPGSYMVLQASTAEQFALDHLISLYSGKKSSVDVSDKMISQAASLAVELLKIADEVQTSATNARPNRQKNSYSRAIAFVIDAVSKRYPAPLVPNEKDQAQWHNDIVAEASERFYGIIEVAHGRVPMSIKERTQTTETSDKTAEQLTPVTTAVEPKENVSDKKVSETVASTPSATVSAAAHALGAKIVKVDTEPSAVIHIIKGDKGFLVPSEDQIGRVKSLCEKADLMGNTAGISDWFERTLGTRISRSAHAPALEAWLKHYESMDIELVRGDALQQTAK